MCEIIDQYAKYVYAHHDTHAMYVNQFFINKKLITQFEKYTWNTSKFLISLVIA